MNSLKEGSIVKGRVIKIEDYGAFVEIMPGVEGLILIPEVTWGNQPINAKEYFKLNQEYRAKIISLAEGSKKIYLSIRRLTDDPWNNIVDKYPLQSRHNGIVKYLVPFGVFVELEDGIGGLVHVSDFSWTKQYSHSSEFTQKGQKIEVLILKIDIINRKLYLGHKQLDKKL